MYTPLHHIQKHKKQYLYFNGFHSKLKIFGIGKNIMKTNQVYSYSKLISLTLWCIIVPLHKSLKKQRQVISNSYTRN